MWKCREGNVEVAYRNWRYGEPNNWQDEDCVVLSMGLGADKRQWVDGSCSNSVRAICKMAGRPVLHV